MSIQSEIDRLAAAKAGLAAAIGTKGVVVPDGATLSEYPALVEQIQGGGGGGVAVSPKEVNFIDYDGTVLYAYTVSEAAALTELPPLPSHAGLICQGWNWSLDDIKALGRSVVVGAMYITDDGKTRLYITIPPNSMAGRPPARSDVPLYISQTVANGVTIDWGDGSPAETLDGTGDVNTTHHYDEAGDYVITLEPADGCELGLGAGSRSYCVMGSAGTNGRVYCNMLQKVEIGRGVTSIGSYAFYYCYSLSSITIPNGVTSIGNYAFYDCYSLVSLTIPDRVTSIGREAIRYCYSLATVAIPAGVTSISDSAFENCFSLTAVTIPDSVTSIGNGFLSSCYSLVSLTIPDRVTSIGREAIRYCYSLATVAIPAGVTSIGSNVFQGCESLSSITIPDGVTSIGSYAFYSCHGMKEYHLLPATPPTLSNTNAFTNIPDDCIIYVHAGSLEAYQTATNWSAYADQMQEEPS